MARPAPVSVQRAGGARRTRHLCALAAIAVLARPGLAPAQAADWDGRVRVGINGLARTSDHSVRQAFTVQKNLEGTAITATTTVGRGPWFDAGVVVRTRGVLGLGAAVSYGAGTRTTAVAAQIPHPFFFDRPRAVAGTAPATHTETAIHLDAVWLVPSKRLDVLLSAGPSLFYATHTLVTDTLYADVYPYDTATFTSAPATRVNTTAAGFNVGADVTLKLAAHVGLGGLVRYSRASGTFTASTDNAVTTDLGGFQAGGGLRVGF